MPNKIKPAKNLIWLLLIPGLISLALLISKATGSKDANINKKPSVSSTSAGKKAEHKTKVNKKKPVSKKEEKPVGQPTRPTNQSKDAPKNTVASGSSAINKSSGQKPVLISSNKLSVNLTVDKGSSKKNYPTSAQSGSTVLAVLQTASSKYGFSLKYTNYSYGAFIEEIDGLANNPANSMYWLYYMNGKLANVGASSQKIKEGDEILWKYEKTN